MSQKTVLSVNELKVNFYTRRGVGRAVDGVSFELRKGETLGLVGESGCGKTVTALSIMGLQPRLSARIVGGQVFFNGEDLTKKSRRDLRAGLDAFTKSLAQELSGRDILVNAIAPGFIDTDMTGELPDEIRDSILARIPQGRMGKPEEIADVVAYLATRASYINGTVVHVNGGMYGG